MFKKNPKLKRGQVSVNFVVQAISDDKTWDEVNAVCWWNCCGGQK